MGKLTDKVAIITGASGGIGTATAALFSREGAKLVLVGRDEARLRQAAEGCDPARTRTVVADVRKNEDTERYVDTAIQAFGGVDVLFANAGYEGKIAPIVDLDVSVLDDLHAIHVRGTFLGMQKVIPRMLERGGGSIVVVSSTAAITSFPGCAAYAASKAALLALVRTAASELAPQNIRVNAMVPGGVDNRMMMAFTEQMAPGHAEELRAGYRQMIPARRVATNEEMSKLALFLASDDSSYCHGASFVADGGMTVV
ncbi:SDR family NAD(P)-dependent oxidoreductase [Polyangium jinanense]|uniref:Glucose 1-dehydrogenase n=1 Tax=Polyangium jinanense TaxID=2829994 RepID=A0A9X3XA92_9BACT|nr:glucose 1-dehydrogenase [Polyangium jinanense]MDC3985273.1 glucose 1-dehydrogenase [Polyangium jinanense]